MTPNFDEIVGSEPAGEERERLRRVHELLVTAGPPPELSPELERTPIPDVGNVLGLRRRKNWGRRAVILLAAAILVAIVFVGGFSGGKGSGVSESVSMVGTKITPNAHGRLIVLQATKGNNWPMQLQETGLPALPANSFYEVYLIRDGKPWGSCGTFHVDSSTQTVTVSLNAPYALRKGDSWWVTRERAGEQGAGPTVLKPAGSV